MLRKLSLHQEDIDMLGLSLDDIESLLTLILENNFFTFNKQVYRQKHGIVMGNHLAPPLAIIFMDSLEGNMLSTAEKKPEFYKQYVDDCLLAWTHGDGFGSIYRALQQPTPVHPVHVLRNESNKRFFRQFHGHVSFGYRSSAKIQTLSETVRQRRQHELPISRAFLHEDVGCNTTIPESSNFVKFNGGTSRELRQD